MSLPVATDAWQRLAQARGGTVPGLFALNPEGGVLAATWAGILRSSDIGATWEPTASGPSVPFAEAVVAQEKTFFAAAADGLYRSTNAGESWHRLLTGTRIPAVVAGGSLVLAGSERDGVLRSDDGGQTWTGANAGLRDTSVLSLALSPDFNTDHLGFAGTSSGLYRSRSDGRAWREVDLGAASEAAVQCIAFVQPAEGERLVFVGTERHGLAWSAAAGNRWAFSSTLAGCSVTSIAADAHGRVAAATDAGVAVGDTCGRGWRMTGTELGPVLSLAFVGSVLLAGLPRDGLARSADGGTTWTRDTRGLTAAVVLGALVVPTSAAQHDVFIVGVQDGILASRDNGRTWTPHNAGLEGATPLGLAASAEGMLFAATSAGVYAAAPRAHSWRRATEGDEHITAIAAARVVPVIVATAHTGTVLRSLDGGQTWLALAPLPEIRAGEIVAATVGAAGSVLVGTRQANGNACVWCWHDESSRWQCILREQAEGVPTLVTRADGAVLVGLGGDVLRRVQHAYERRGAERRPVWRRTRVGPPRALVASVACAPPAQRAADATASTPAGTVFAATAAGVFVSPDGGDSFEPWSEGLHPPPVVALALSPDFDRDGQVFAVGLGGTIWCRRYRQANL